VVEGEGPGRGEAAAPGLIQDKPHQLQSDLRVRLMLLQSVSPFGRQLSAFRFGSSPVRFRRWFWFYPTAYSKRTTCFRLYGSIQGMWTEPAEIRRYGKLELL
jgi:hypothetical protein